MTAMKKLPYKVWCYSYTHFIDEKTEAQRG